MKKENIKKIAIDKSKVVMETLELILTDSIPVEGRLEFDAIKQGKENICTLEIYVPNRGYERHWLMDIPVIYSTLFYKQIVTDLLDHFRNLEKIKISDLYKEDKSELYSIKLENSLGSIVTLYFVWQGENFDEVIEFYNKERKNKG